MMHAGVAAADAAKALAGAAPLTAAKTFLTPAVAESIGATVAELGLLTRLGRRRGPAVAPRPELAS
jgi:hypothetical protein